MFAQQLHIRSFGLNSNDIAEKSRKFLSASKMPFLDIFWARVGHKEALIRTLDGHSSHVESVAISPDNTKIVSGSNDNTIKVWGLDTGKLLGL